jgi:hypothetical protein
MHENFVGPKIKKAWRMKPKRFAGNSTTKTGGRSSEARPKVRTQKAPEAAKKK